MTDIIETTGRDRWDRRVYSLSRAERPDDILATITVLPKTWTQEHPGEGYQVNNRQLGFKAKFRYEDGKFTYWPTLKKARAHAASFIEDTPVGEGMRPLFMLPTEGLTKEEMTNAALAAISAAGVLDEDSE